MKVLFLALSLITLELFYARPVLAQQNNAIGVIVNHYAARSFSADPIPRADLDRIIQAGVRAPSAGNRQPWHFTVVQNQTLARQLISNIADGSILIVVSAQGDGKTNITQTLDGALAVQSIYLAAQALGYGSRIYTNPVENLNNRLKSDFSIPSGYSAVAVIRVGKLQGTIDAVSAASPRKRAQDIVTYK
jgi:nitroreductase